MNLFNLFNSGQPRGAEEDGVDAGGGHADQVEVDQDREEMHLQPVLLCQVQGGGEPEEPQTQPAMSAWPSIRIHHPPHPHPHLYLHRRCGPADRSEGPAFRSFVFFSL